MSVLCAPAMQNAKPASIYVFIFSVLDFVSDKIQTKALYTTSSSYSLFLFSKFKDTPNYIYSQLLQCSL